MAGQIDERFAPQHFRHQTTVPLRYEDIDAAGHVHNVKHLVFMEQARIAYARDVMQWDGVLAKLRIVVAHIEVDYLARVVFGDTIKIQTRCSRLGNKSFDLAYVLHSQQQGSVAATGLTTLVAYDFAAGHSTAIPVEWRERIEGYESGLS